MLGNFKKVYIAGPIFGLPNGNFSKFKEMEDLLDSIKINCINPRRIPEPEELKGEKLRGQMMILSLKSFFDCDAVIFLEGWENSKGASIEYNLAKYLNLPTFNDNFRPI